MTETKHYIYTLTPTRLEMVSTGPTPHEAEIVKQHFLYLKKLTEKAVVFLAGRTLNNDEKTFGICILRADSEAAAREIMHNDPAVKNKVMRAELFPYRIALFNEAVAK
jgi:uncharacterized protein YciI